MMQKTLLFLSLFLIVLSGKLSAQSGNCSTADPFCSENSYSFPASTGTTAEAGPDYGCLTTQPNPAWYLMQIDNPGNLVIDMYSTPSEDIDFIVWGPYTSMTNICGQLDASYIIDCSYSTASTETATITGAVAGEYYMFLVTNYSNNPCDITFSQTSGTGSSNCAIVCPVVGFDGLAQNGSTPFPLPATMACSDPWIYLAYDDPSVSGGYLSPSYVVNVSFGSNSATDHEITLSENGSQWYTTGNTIGGSGSSYSLTAYGVSPAATQTIGLCENSAGAGGTNMTYQILDQHSNTIILSGTWNVADGTCQNITIPINTLSGIATFSGTGVGTWDSGYGIFDPAVAGPGVHPVTYSWDNENGCSGTSTVNITVTNSNSPNWTTTSYCASTASANLNTLITGTSGGTWSGTGVSGNNFLPSSVGAGSYSVTYTVGSGSCQVTQTHSITVTANPNATITAAGPFCVSSGAINLSAATGGGTWSGTGITNSTNGTFNPATAGAGNHIITYTVTSGGCTGTDTETISVTANPNATITAAGPFCTSGAATNLSAATGGGTWSGTGITNSSLGTFNPSTAGVGTHTITYSVTSGGCTGTDTETITVNSATNSTITPAGPFCTTAASTNLSAATGGGSWSGTGITNAALGTFNPSTGGAGTHIITYTISGSCGSSDTETITVNTTPNATITAAGPFCTSDAATNLSAATGGGTWSGTGITNSSLGTFNPATAGVGSHTITYSITSSGCTGTDTETITVNSATNATITPAGPYCTSAGATNLSAATGGGSWSGTGITNAALGTFNPATAGPGSHTITYTISGTCGSSDTETITVNTTPNATITAAGPFCTSDAAINLSAATGGGTWSGTGITNGALGTFNPSTAGAGSHTITYTITSSGCTGTDTETITVNTTPNATITATSPFCTSDAATNLAATTGGGTWSGTGITNAGTGTFNPATAGAGSHTITYSVSSGGCSNTDTEIITVNATPNSTITAVGALCPGDPPVNLTAATSGGTFSGSGVSGTTFNPSVAGNGSHTITYTVTVNGCTSTDTETITVNNSSDPTITAVPNLCTGDASVTLNAVTGGGIWSGTGVSGNTFNPATAGPGTHLITYTISGTCGSSDTETITVNASPNATITAAGPFCTSAPATTLTAASSGGTWSGNGITNSALGTFDPSTAGVGTHLITYTNISGGCTGTDTETITVNNSSDPTITAVPALCTNDAPATLTAATPGGIWTGPSVSGNTFNPATAGAGTHLITYTITGTCGGSDTETITVNATPNATITATSAFCSSDAATNLTSATNGGTWSGTGITNASSGTFNPSVAGAGTHTITYSVTSNGCTGTDTETITVNTTPDATITAAGPFCSNDASTNLISASGGGTWSGNGITNASLGTFNPTTSGSGTHTITYTVSSGGCTGTDTESILVNATPDATIVPTGALCPGDAPVTLTAATTGGTFSGPGVNGNSFDPAVAGVGSHTITYTVTVNGCTGTDTETIPVSNSTDPTINSVTPLCTADLPASLSAATGGGIWSGPGVVSSSFDPSIAGPGNHTITYTISGACGSSDTETVTVSASPDATITPVNSLCTGDALITLTSATSGGTFSGTGVSGNNFDPSVSGAGSFIITYDITSGLCSSSDTETITVNLNSDATISPAGPFCSGDVPFTLSAASGGGLWTGNGISGSTFDPALAGPGTHSIIYSISGFCGDTDTVSIIVNPSTDATINPSGPFCTTDGPVNLTAVSPGGTWAGAGITNTNSGTFNPSVAGAGIHTITYSITGSCGSTDTETIIVTANQDPTITSVAPFCSANGPFNLSAASTGGTWGGTGITDIANGTFNPMVAGPGTHTVTYAILGSCGGTDTEDIVVVQSKDATINPAGPFCNNDLPVNLTAIDLGGTWGGTGITNSTSGTFNPAIAGVGTHTITYQIDSVCGDTNTIQILVNANANATITDAGPFCNDDPPVNLNAAPGGTWTGTGITSPLSGTFNPAVSGPGTWDIIYAISGACGDTDTVSIVVNQVADASISPAGPFCAVDSAQPLVASQSGGTWDGIGIINPVSGIFDPSLVNSSTTITYIIGGLCPDTGTASIIVNPKLDATITSDSVLCDYYNDDTLTATNSTFTDIWKIDLSFLNSSLPVYSPGSLLPDTYLVTHIIQNQGNCGDTAYTNLIIIKTPKAEVLGPNSFCNNSPIITLNAVEPTPEDNWSGPGIIDMLTGLFDPADSNINPPQTVTITHLNADPSGKCTSSDTMEIFVGKIAPMPLTVSDTVCVDGDLTLFAQGVNDSLNWYMDSSGFKVPILFNESIFEPQPPLIDTSLADSVYTFFVQQQNGICPSDYAPVTLTVVNIGASFLATPPDSGEIPIKLIFNNTSFGADSMKDNYLWTFGDGDSSVLFNPLHTYQDTGIFTINLTITDQFGVCKADTTYSFYAKGTSLAVPPDIFTPNGDGVNDVFNLIHKNLTVSEGIIYNRWGELMFKWNSVESGWDGTTLSGTPAPDGVYFYMIKATGKDRPEPELKTYEFNGHVTLVR